MSLYILLGHSYFDLGTAVIYDYGEQYFCAHYLSQNEIIIAILLLWSSPWYAISLFTYLFVG